MLTPQDETVIINHLMRAMWDEVQESRPKADRRDFSSCGEDYRATLDTLARAALHAITSAQARSIEYQFGPRDGAIIKIAHAVMLENMVAQMRREAEGT